MAEGQAEETTGGAPRSSGAAPLENVKRRRQNRGMFSHEAGRRKGGGRMRRKISDLICLC